MKKPVCRNADKALCAYFTPGHWPGQVDFVEGEGAGIFLKIQLRLAPPERCPGNVLVKEGAWSKQGEINARSIPGKVSAWRAGNASQRIEY